MAEDRPIIAIVGASGAVGREVLSILAEREHPAHRLRLFGSSRSAGVQVGYRDHELIIDEFRGDALGCDAAVLCTSAEFSRAHAPGLVEQGLVVVDNSSAFRMEPSVPLVIPEINGEEVCGAGDTKGAPTWGVQHGSSGVLVANPNCSTIMMLLAIEPIRRACGVSSVVVSTYQAVSGAGQQAIEELRTETERAMRGEDPDPGVFPMTCAFNVFPHESPVSEVSGFCGEEEKMIGESRKILGDPGLEVLPTCVRVPVERCHAQSILIETGRRVTRSEVRSVLSDCDGVEFVEAGAVTPLNTERTDRVRVSRLRAWGEEPTSRFAIWVCCDQLRKGAALNAIQVLDLLLNDQERAGP